MNLRDNNDLSCHLFTDCHPEPSKDQNKDTGRASVTVVRTKQPLSKQIRLRLESQPSPLLNKLIVTEHSGKTCFRFWQEGAGFARNLFSPAAISASIDYFHTNPVKRGLCRRAIDFTWSSARFYELGVDDQKLPNLVRPDPEWFHQPGTTLSRLGKTLA
jgi:putative transposase